MFLFLDFMLGMNPHTFLLQGHGHQFALSHAGARCVFWTRLARWEAETNWRICSWDLQQSLTESRSNLLNKKQTVLGVCEREVEQVCIYVGENAAMMNHDHGTICL